MRVHFKNYLTVGLCVIAGCVKTPDEPGSTVSERRDVAPARHVPLDGQQNFRDLGGYETSDGRKVKSRQVFRSGELHKLSDADVARLEALGIRTVANFLTDSEIAARGKDRLPDGVRILPLPMQAGNMADLTDIVLKARTTGDFSQVPPDFNPDIHRILMEQGRHNYAKMLREVIDPANRPFVFHCSHGIHRTGTAAAILLSALGVPWEVIREDYLLSNDFREDEIGKRVGQLRMLDAKNRGIPLEAVDTTNIEAFYILDGSYIDASLAAAIDEFGSMEAYIKDGLGVSDDEIDLLRSELLEDDESLR